MHYRALHLGVLIIRLGLGIMFLIHGIPKLMGGPAAWEGLGGAMASIGVDFAPVFWGFMAAIAETLGGLALITGFIFRPAMGMLVFTMFIAFMMHWTKGDPFIPSMSYPLELMLVFIGFLVAGPGNFTIPEIFNKDGQD